MVFTYSAGIVVSANYFWIINQRKKGPSTGMQFLNEIQDTIK